MTQRSVKCSGCLVLCSPLLDSSPAFHSTVIAAGRQLRWSVSQSKLRLSVSVLYGSPVTMERGTPERRLLSAGTQWTRELFQPFSFFLSINLLLRRGSCSVPRAPTFGWALVHSWPRTIMLEISHRHRTLPIAPALLLADPLSASRALEVIFCLKECYCGMSLSGTVGTLLITLDRLDNNSLCVKHCSSLKVDCYHSLQKLPLVGIRIPISQVSVGERKWLADGLNNFCLPKLKKLKNLLLSLFISSPWNPCGHSFTPVLSEIPRPSIQWSDLNEYGN